MSESDRRWRRRLRRVVLLITVALVASFTTTGCGWLGKHTVGAFLQPLRDDVNSIIDNASAQGQTLLLTAGGQVDLALSNAESAFADQLTRSIDRLDDASRRSLDRVAALVNDLSSTSNTVLNNAIDGSQQLINSIPFANKNPQVRLYAPHFSSAAVTDMVPLSVKGNFVWASEKKLAPRLELAGKQYPAAGVQTSELTFLLPPEAFRAAPGAMSRLLLTLTVPYEKGKVFKTIRPGVFHVILTVLPARPLQALTVTSDVTVTGLVSHTLVAPPGSSPGGGGWRVQSWGDCKAHDDPHVIAATTTWSIVPSSVTVHYIARDVAARGKATVTNAQTTGFMVTGHTDPNCYGWPIEVSYDSGDITYYVTYTETQPVQTTSSRKIDLMQPPNVPPKWGDSIVVPVVRGSWKVSARTWDGTIFETSHEDNSTNPYIAVKDDGNSITIKVVSTGQIIALP